MDNLVIKLFHSKVNLEWDVIGLHSYIGVCSKIILTHDKKV